MRTLYIECNMGAAGDMLMAALLELHPDPEGFIGKMNSLGLPGVDVKRVACAKCGITGTRVAVSVSGFEEECEDVEAGHIHPAAQGHQGSRAGCEHGHHHAQAHEANGSERPNGHSHTGMAEIGEIIRALPVSDMAKAGALEVYGIIAEAEGRAHGKPASAVHFHEVGMLDAVADVVGVCLLMEELGPQKVVVSPINVGSGQVICAHGVLPVPAPATAFILKGVPTYSGQIRGELCTPTGAALLKHFAHEFSAQPMMSVNAIGYGMGKKDFPAANCVRAFIGESKRQSSGIVEIASNLDDMTGEDLGFALGLLLEGGALDVYTVPIQMKKNRPGNMLVCLCYKEDEETLAGLMLKHTTSFGVRASNWRRHTLERSVETIETEYGPVRLKTGNGFGVSKRKAEYEDIARIAQIKGRSILEVRTDLEKRL